MKLVSVIVPIYKVEKYLGQCIDSILSQTYSNLEIILVDDGSPDSCPEICENYVKKNHQIKVIHKRNEGLGEARNTGLEVAKGTYVYFVDSDDWLEKNMIEKMVYEMEKESADLVMCGFKKMTPNQEPIIYRVVKNKTIQRGLEVQTKIFLPMIAQKSTVAEDYTINMCVWSNLYRRDIIERNKIRFLSERKYLSEDICFNLQYLLHINCAVMIPEACYCYRYNPNSLTNKYKGPEYEMLVSLYQEVCKLASQTSALEDLEFRQQRFFLTKLREILFRLSNSDLSLKEKRRVCQKILNDTTLQKVLFEYPIKTYQLKYKIPIFFIKTKSCLGTLGIFYLFHHLRKRK